MPPEKPRRRRSGQPPFPPVPEERRDASGVEGLPGAHEQETPTVWLARVLREAHLSHREASKLIGREESYFWQMLQKGRSRSLPTPEELDRLIPRLKGVTLLEALEKVWNVDRRQIMTDLAVFAARGEADARWNELDPADREKLDTAIRVVLRNADRRRESSLT